MVARSPFDQARSIRQRARAITLPSRTNAETGSDLRLSWCSREYSPSSHASDAVPPLLQRRHQRSRRDDPRDLARITRPRAILTNRRAGSCWLPCASVREHGGNRAAQVAPPATSSCARCRSRRNALEPDAPRRLDRSRPGGFDRNPWLRALVSRPRRYLAGRRQVRTTTTARVAGAADRRRRWQARRTVGHQPANTSSKNWSGATDIFGDPTARTRSRSVGSIRERRAAKHDASRWFHPILGWHRTSVASTRARLGRPRVASPCPPRPPTGHRSARTRPP